MIEGKDDNFNALKKFTLEHPVAEEAVAQIHYNNLSIVEFVFSKNDESSRHYYNHFFDLAVLDMLKGKEYFDILEKFRDLQFEAISYTFKEFSRRVAPPLHDFNVFDLTERLLDDVHEDLQADIIDVSWGNSYAILQKIDVPPKEIVITEYGETVIG